MHAEGAATPGATAENQERRLQIRVLTWKDSILGDTHG